MSQPRRHPDLTLDPTLTGLISSDQARRAARLVVSRYPDQPHVARYLLEVLGLLDTTPAATDLER